MDNEFLGPISLHLPLHLVSSRKEVKLESENNGIPLFFENFLHHDECSTY